MQPTAHSMQILKKSADHTNKLNNVYKPVIFDLKKPDHQKELSDLLEKKTHIQVFDYIESQVKEFIKCSNPSVIYSPEQLDQITKAQFNEQNPDEYGVWVYYPWLEKLVHILDEKEYAVVRTNRNKHKITAEEQELLSRKKIGVMGLSVGQSVSMSLAMERGFGELRIADFDELDLSNLNRIRSGVHNLKIKKTVVVAREIAEIDPFLNIVCFHEGITEENLDQFLTEGGTLDLLIDECDSFDVKISAREKAKQLGIPVLMEGSDRCTIDIERFDLEPERPLLHGFVKGVNMTEFKNLKTLDERLPYIAPVTGIETLSPRMKASAVEIMTSISTWPQLASAVNYGGGVTSDLSRRILLDQLHVSGRFFLDMDELICDTPKQVQESVVVETDKIDIAAYLKANALNQDGSGTDIPLNLLENLINVANQAPSGGNNQPWKWHYENKTLHLFLNKEVSGAYLDPDYISSYLSLGAAIENLLLQAAVLELDVQWKFTPEFLPDHVALFRFAGPYRASQEEKLLAAQIENRHTNRKAGTPDVPQTHDLDQLGKAIEEIPGAAIHWITDPEKMKQLGLIAGEADLFRMFIPQAHQDFITKEMRWTVEETESTGDGIGIHSLDLSNNNQIGLRLMKDFKAIQLLKQIEGGSIFKRLPLSQFQQSSAIGLLTLPEISSLNFLKGGIASEKLWLKATASGYQVHPVNVPLIFFYKSDFEKENQLSPQEKIKISKIHQDFKEIFGITDNIAEIFLFRLFKAQPSPVRTIRKPFIKTLSIGTAKTEY
ncbi:ThiF family protein [Pedobacter nutrimenti]|uniref:ThiF family protein n=2 Tax=Pedobacter nutrimenti TaxID=1241337 RepID=A0A318UJL2_9SPHI|nr:ThiF family protein [Pedobacter nutrimenti]